MTHSDHSEGECIVPHTISATLDPFLYPFYIEYVLLAAFMTYKLLISTGRRHYHGNIKEESDSGGVTRYNGCHKANAGLVLGLLPLTAVIVGACVFIYNTALGYESVLCAIHVVFDLSMNGLSLFALIPTVFLLRRFAFPRKTNLTLDHGVLLMTLMGYYILLYAIVQGSFTIHQYEAGNGLSLGVMSVVDLIQCTLQTGFIIHASQRHPGHDGHVHMKPGRTLLTLLILFNFAMWVINTFELKEVLNNEISIRYFGLIAWVVLVDVSLPLAIFFRFHSAVCLTEIWIKIYEQRSSRNKGTSEATQSTRL